MPVFYREPTKLANWTLGQCPSQPRESHLDTRRHHRCCAIERPPEIDDVAAGAASQHFLVSSASLEACQAPTVGVTNPSLPRLEFRPDLCDQSPIVT